MPLELCLAAAIVAALTLYLLSGGADFGGGVWDLLASGPRRDQQRALIEKAIGPIWEANHVWLILAVVVLFTAFPPAFALISVALHVPLTLFLLGIVFRGATFAFRSFDASPRRGVWSVPFSVASLLGPLLLGVMVGALTAGRLQPDDFFSSWLAPFPLAVGGLCLALCAFLAAVYLAHEAAHGGPARREAHPTIREHSFRGSLAEDFRRRALLAGAAAVLLAGLALILSRSAAPHVQHMLLGRALVVLALAALSAAAAAVALGTRRFAAARVLAAAGAALVVVGWAAAQYPYLVPGQLTVYQAAASPRTLRLLLVALVVGVPVLVPSLVLLFRVFKAGARA